MRKENIKKSPALRKAELRIGISISIASIVGLILFIVFTSSRDITTGVAFVVCVIIALILWCFWPEKFVIDKNCLIFDSVSGQLVFDPKHQQHKYLKKEQDKFFESLGCKEPLSVEVEDEAVDVDVSYTFSFLNKGRMDTKAVMVSCASYLDKSELIQLVASDTSLLQDAQKYYTRWGETNIVSCWFDRTLINFCSKISAEEMSTILKDDLLLNSFVSDLANHFRSAYAPEGSPYSSITVNFTN